MHLVMFDLDGTLLNSNALDVYCFHAALASVMGIDSIADDWTDFKYVTDEGIVTEIISNQLNRRATKQEVYTIRRKILELLQEQAHANREWFTPVPGAPALFRSLTAMGNCKVAIATGCWKASAVLKLSTAEFNVENLTIASCDDSHRREEIMRIAYTRAVGACDIGAFETVTYVGDGVWDIRAAKALGYAFIGVGSSCNQEALRQAGATSVLSDFRDTQAFYSRLDEIWGAYRRP